MFEYEDERAANLSAEQMELLENWRSKPQVVSIYLVKVIGLPEIGQNEQLSLNLPDEEILTIHRTSGRTIDQDRLRWSGVIEDSISEVNILVDKENITGMIRSKNHNYDIYSFRDTGFHLLVEIDPSKFEKPLPPLEVNGGEDESGQHEKNSDGAGVVSMMSDPEIRVLVVYTTNAKSNYPGNINNMITIAEGNLEDAFNNSGVNADITVVHTAEISYNESVDNTLNLCRLTMSPTFDPREDTSSDACDGYSTGMITGYMDEIHYWRYEHGAHLVVLITGTGGSGIAWMPANNNYAFSIARYDVAESDYVMAHEIGHNLAANHDLDNAENSVFLYAHGYIYDPAKWNTIMAYSPPGYTRINRYSNPDKYFAGVPTGTAELEDNARAMNNWVGFVANFNPPVQPPIVTISGPSSLPEPGTATYTANADGGSGDFSYEWKLFNDNCPSQGCDVGTTQIVNVGLTQGSHNLEVTVTDNETSLTGSDTKYIYVAPGDGTIIPDSIAGLYEPIPDDFAVHANYPNPFNPVTTIRYELPEPSHVTLIIYDIMGREVRRLVNDVVHPGYHTATWDSRNEAGNLVSSGVYLYRFTATPAVNESEFTGITESNTMLLVK